MKETVYLILNRGGVVAMRKKLPGLDPGQMAVRVRVSVDSRFFETHIAEVALDIPANMLIAPQVEITPIEEQKAG